MSDDLRTNSSSPGGPERKGVQGRRSSSRKGGQAGESATGTCAWLVSLSRVGRWPQVHEQIPDPTIRKWDGGAGRGHVTMGVTEEGFRVRAEGARKGQNRVQLAREEAGSVRGGGRVCREEAETTVA